MTAETRVVLSAGSNVGDRDAHLASVTEAFADHLVAVSPVYATAPWGGVEQPDFHNITLIVAGERTPADWLAAGLELEQRADRTRDVRWGPRTLDVDVISAETAGSSVISTDPALTLPHPRAAIRAFVLVPWLAIDPGARLWTPDGPRDVADLVAELSDDERAGVRKVGERSGVRAGRASEAGP